MGMRGPGGRGERWGGRRMLLRGSCTCRVSAVRTSPAQGLPAQPTHPQPVASLRGRAPAARWALLPTA